MNDMSSLKLKALLDEQSEIVYTKVDGDGKHYTVTVVSDAFVKLPKVKRQLWVYTLLNSHITSGALHAIQLNTWTQEEWHKISAESGLEE